MLMLMCFLGPLHVRLPLEAFGPWAVRVGAEGAHGEAAGLSVDLGSVGYVLGGSWVVISGVISVLIWVISIVTLLITPLITTHEPPSKGL